MRHDWQEWPPKARELGHKTAHAALWVLWTTIIGYGIAQVLIGNG